MNFRNHPRARRIASCLSTLSLVAYSTSFVAPVYAQNTGTPQPTQTTPEKVKKQDELDRAKKVTPPAPGNPAVFIDPSTGSGNNLRDFNRDGTPRVPNRPKRDYGDHQNSPNDPRMVADNKDLPMYGYNYFDYARRAVEARRNGLINILSGGTISNGNVANRSDSRRSTRYDANDPRNSDSRDDTRDNNRNSNGNNNRSGSDTDNNGNRRRNDTDTTGSNRDGRSASDSRDNQDTRDARDNSDTNDTSRSDDSVSDAQRRRDARQRDVDSTDAALEDGSTVQGRLQGLSGRNNNSGTNQNNGDRNGSANQNGTNQNSFRNNDGTNRNNSSNGSNQNNQNNPNTSFNAPGTRSTVSGYEGIIDPITQLTNNIIASPPAYLSAFCG